MYPYQRTPMGNPYIRPIWWVFMGKLSPRIPRLNTINTMVVHVRERYTLPCPLSVYENPRHMAELGRGLKLGSTLRAKVEAFP